MDREVTPVAEAEVQEIPEAQEAIPEAREGILEDQEETQGETREVTHQMHQTHQTRQIHLIIIIISLTLPLQEEILGEVEVIQVEEEVGVEVIPEGETMQMETRQTMTQLTLIYSL